MAFAPEPAGAGTNESPWLAFVGARMVDSGWTLNLFTVRLNGRDFGRASTLPNATFRGWVGEAALYWLREDAILVPVRKSMMERYKTELWVVDPRSGERRPQEYLEAFVFNMALSPDARWLAYTSDDGVYAQRLALDGASEPLFLVSPERGFQIDW
jgi:hypothetical protein